MRMLYHLHLIAARYWYVWLVGCAVSLAQCGNSLESSARFAAVDLDKAGILFANELSYTDSLNPYTYKSFYNGAGVAIGDLNADGLQDIIFAGNLVDNQVYISLGDWKFREVASEAGLAAANSWVSGVTTVDVNGDGLLDVYICKSGPPSKINRRNELRINQGDGTFVDVASAAGVDDLGFSIQGVFLDYDRDGDLDLYLLNNSIRSVGGYDIRPGQREVRDSLGGNKLYQNQLAETGKLSFTDVSAAAGIYGSSIGFGLGVSVGDVNADGWPDLYVSNDFFERDYLYINTGDGQFEERLIDLVPETSLGAMGADMADLNGDGFPEIFVSEMLPESAKRYRSKANFESYDRRSAAKKQGYHNQYSRNVLLLNQGGLAYLDVSRQAGVEASEWSWGALLADLDNDGRRDIFVANGIYKDLLDQDYIRYVANPDNIRRLIKEGGSVISELIDSMPSEAVSNKAYRNLGGPVPAFADSSAAWGLSEPNFSSGSTYADLDNDGDLDLVISTVNAPPLLYRNQTSDHPSPAHYLTVSLRDTLSVANRYAWGSKVSIFTNAGVKVAEVAPVKGFMSTVDANLHFGLDTVNAIDSIVVAWSSGGQQIITQPGIDQTLVISRTDTAPLMRALPIDSLDAQWTANHWVHRESNYDDFDRYPLLIEMVSAEGPALAVLDRLDEPQLIFVGGGRGQQSALFAVSSTGKLKQLDVPAFAKTDKTEDVAAVWLDADGDGDSDLFVAGGSDETTPAQFALRPRLYINNGQQNFTERQRAVSGVDNQVCGALAVLDADADGDMDIFYGTHFTMGQYGLPSPSFLLLNNGTGVFAPAPTTLLDSMSRVRAATVVEVDGDTGPELAIAQEYGSVRILDVEEGQLRQLAVGSTGVWRSLLATDLDGDGIDELVAGNMGLNTRFRASEAAPLTIHIGDFDGNGSFEHVPSASIGGKQIVASQLSDLVGRMPVLRKRFQRYSAYAKTDVSDILDLSREQFHLDATELRTGVFRYSSAAELSFTPLPAVAQMSCVRAIVQLPEEEGALPTLFLAGNYSYVKPEFGGQLGSYGVTLTAQSDGGWTVDEQRVPLLSGEVRGLAVLSPSVNSKLPLLIAARNNDAILQYALGNDN